MAVINSLGDGCRPSFALIGEDGFVRQLEVGELHRLAGQAAARSVQTIGVNGKDIGLAPAQPQGATLEAEQILLRRPAGVHERSTPGWPPSTAIQSSS